LIPVFRPSFDDEEWQALREPLQNGWVTIGPKVKEFEEKFAEYVGASHAVALNSGTAAIHEALRGMDVAGGEVITTSLTFVSTNHCILYENATPVFADIEPDTLNIDAGEVERLISPRTKAIMVVHYGGHACDMDRILEMARPRGIKVIEDAAHACGTEYRGRRVGAIGDATCFSFHAVKNMTTGDGGMVTFHDDALDQRLRNLRWMGLTGDTWARSSGAAGAKYSWYYDAEEVGFKYYMNDIAAAIGLVQLRKLDRMNARRRELTRYYNDLFADVEWVRTPVEHEYTRSSNHNYVVRVPNRDELIVYLREHGISASVHYVPNHFYPMYKPFAAQLPVTERVWKQIVTLPLFPYMTESQVEQVVGAVRDFGVKMTAPAAAIADR
jgi:perosamine synthetase